MLLAWLVENNGLRSAFVSIDAMAIKAAIAAAIQSAVPNYPLAVKASQPILHVKVEACIAAALPGTVTAHTDYR